MRAGDAPAPTIRSSRRVGYDNRTGFPEGIPGEFVRIIINFPDRVYGTWWHVNDGEQKCVVEGWYLWINSLNLLGVTYGDKLAWANAPDLENGLVRVADELLNT